MTTPNEAKAQRLKVLDEVDAAVRKLAPKYMNPGPNPLIEVGFAHCKRAVYAVLQELRDV